MQVSVSGHHYTVSERTRSYIQGETAKLEKFYSPVVDAHATITEEGREHRVDLAVSVHAHTLKSAGAADNRMISQLKKLRDKQRSRRVDSREEVSVEE